MVNFVDLQNFVPNLLIWYNISPPKKIRRNSTKFDVLKRRSSTKFDGIRRPIFFRFVLRFFIYFLINLLNFADLLNFAPNLLIC